MCFEVSKIHNIFKHTIFLQFQHICLNNLIVTGCLEETKMFISQNCGGKFRYVSYVRISPDFSCLTLRVHVPPAQEHWFRIHTYITDAYVYQR
jgi:hypothetical protein